MKSTNKILVAAVVLLLVANIALVAFIVLGKGKPADKKAKPDPAEVMYKELSMTPDQQKQHKQLKEEYFRNMRPYFDSVRAAKSAFYGLLKDTNVTDSTLMIYSNRISQRQAEIDRRTFAHFRRLRTIFTPEQQPRFDAFVEKMMQRSRKDSTAKK